MERWVNELGASVGFGQRFIVWHGDPTEKHGPPLSVAVAASNVCRGVAVVQNRMSLGVDGRAAALMTGAAVSRLPDG